MKLDRIGDGIQKLKTEIESLQEQLASSESRREALIQTVQKHQPSGSPPPGDEVMLTEWVLETLESRREAAVKEHIFQCSKSNNDLIAMKAERDTAIGQARRLAAEGCNGCTRIPPLQAALQAANDENREYRKEVDELKAELAEERANHAACHDTMDQTESARLKLVEQLKSSESRREAAENEVKMLKAIEGGGPMLAMRQGSKIRELSAERDTLAQKLEAAERSASGWKEEALRYAQNDAYWHEQRDTPASRLSLVEKALREAHGDIRHLLADEIGTEEALEGIGLRESDTRPIGGQPGKEDK